MKHATAAQVIIAALSLSSQAIIGANEYVGYQFDNNMIAVIKYLAKIDPVSYDRKLLGEDSSEMSGHIVIGNDGDNGIFVATNATNFPQSTSNGTLSVGISDSEDCNSGAYGSALEFQLEDSVTYEINELGMIESERGWFQQSIRELQGNSTLPVTLAELVGGSGSEYGLAVYLLSSGEELLGCASMKKLDDKEKAAEYYELLFGSSQDQEAVNETPSSGTKAGLFVSAIAAVGAAFVLGDVFAL